MLLEPSLDAPSLMLLASNDLVDRPLMLFASDDFADRQMAMINSVEPSVRLWGAYSILAVWKVVTALSMPCQD